MEAGAETRSPLVGWKAIAAYFHREERTVMRWAATRGMPVQRVPGAKRASVYASPDALDAWLGTRTPTIEVPAVEAQLIEPEAPDTAPLPVAAARSPWPRRTMWIAGALTAMAVIAAILFFMATPARPAHAASPDFVDPQARAAYLQATYDWNLRTRNSLIRAIDEYGQAISRDPRSAAAYAGLANAYLLIREYAAMPDAEAYSRAEAAADAALAIDPQAMEAQRARAFIDYWWHGRPDRARREFHAALASAPDDALTHHWYANALMSNGEAAAALREISRAREIDPTATAILVDYGRIAAIMGRRAEGLSLLRTIVHDDPNNLAAHRALALDAITAGRLGDYLDEASAVARLRSDHATLASLDTVRSAYARGGQTAGIAALTAEAQAGVARNAGNLRLAEVLAFAGQRDAAAVALSRACRRSEPGTVWSTGNVWLRRSLPREDIAALCGDHSLVS